MDRVALRQWSDEQHVLLKGECPFQGRSLNEEVVAVLNQAHCTYEGHGWLSRFMSPAPVDVEHRYHVVAALCIIVADAWDQLTCLAAAFAGSRRLDQWYEALDHPRTSQPVGSIAVTCRNIDLLTASIHAIALRPSIPIDEPIPTLVPAPFDKTVDLLQNRTSLANPGRIAEPSARVMSLSKLRALSILRAGFHSLQVA